jgi:hypothetical protein
VGFAPCPVKNKIYGDFATLVHEKFLMRTASPLSIREIKDTFKFEYDHARCIAYLNSFLNMNDIN